jgi:hypothetical protein
VASKKTLMLLEKLDIETERIIHTKEREKEVLDLKKQVGDMEYGLEELYKEYDILPLKRDLIIFPKEKYIDVEDGEVIQFEKFFTLEEVRDKLKEYNGRIPDSFIPFALTKKNNLICISNKKPIGCFLWDRKNELSIKQKEYYYKYLKININDYDENIYEISLFLNGLLKRIEPLNNKEIEDEEDKSDEYRESYTEEIELDLDETEEIEELEELMELEEIDKPYSITNEENEETSESISIESEASLPGKIKLSKSKLKFLEKEYFNLASIIANIIIFIIKHVTVLTEIREHLKNGSTEPAIVVSENPLLIAAYTEDIDCVVMLKFEDRIRDKYNIKTGDRLITINTYTYRGDSDLIPGPDCKDVWTGVYPIIADFVTEDYERLDYLKEQFDNQKWEHVKKLGNEYLTIKPNTYRYGSPYNSSEVLE